jgi:hypothetical protein
LEKLGTLQRIAMCRTSWLLFPVSICVAFASQTSSPAQRATHISQKVAAAPTPVDWQTSPLDLDLRGMNGEDYAFRCPPGKPLMRRVVGSGTYTDDSR